MKLLFALLPVWLLLPFSVKAQPAYPSDAATPDTLAISLLTCAPGHQVYRLYGHTAIRALNPQQPKDDNVYNFGWFSFDTPNFVLKFVFGLTDYSMAQQSTALFLSQHLRDDMPITQQELNLTPAEAAAVKAAMQRILLEKGFEQHLYPTQGVDGRIDTLTTLTPFWTYRYNFLYDNCTTRAVAAIVKAIEDAGEQVVFPTLANSRQTLTQRGMIHEFTKQSPWFEFGQDLLLGPEVDRVFTIQEMTCQNFLPTYAQNFFQMAQIKSADGSMRPLVKRTEPLFPLIPQPQTPALPFGPNAAFWTLLGVAALLTLGEWRSRNQSPAIRRAWRIWLTTLDTLCFLGMGLVGVMLTLMVGWSEHPAVGTNWLLTIFNPLLLIYLPLYFWFKRTGRRDVIAPLLVLGSLAYGVVFLFGIQQFPTPAHALACILLIRGIALYKGRQRSPLLSVRS